MIQVRPCRFEVGAKVLAKVPGSQERCAGTVVKTNHVESGQNVPYKIELNDGRSVAAPVDHDKCVKLASKSVDCDTSPVNIASSQAHKTKYDPVNLSSICVRKDESVTSEKVAYLILMYKEDILNIYSGILQKMLQGSPDNLPYLVDATYQNLARLLVNFSGYMHHFEESTHMIGTVMSAMNDLVDMNMDMLILHEFMLKLDIDAERKNPGVWKENGYRNSELCDFYRYRLCSVGDRGLYTALATLGKNMEMT
tara:strand:+ start:5071 stop:5829 length:759 start_codon:yes stop_codon:yes gene_type:complete